MVIKNFGYEGLMRYFEDISAIPRASYKEEKIAEYLCNFAKERGLEYYHDENNNVLINAPATAGMENSPAILLQGHTDMVCAKLTTSAHDFEKDALDLYMEGSWLRARGTTLGGDDGIAVAFMLALLDGEPTVRTFYKEDGHFRLQPANRTMFPVIVNSLMILGRVVTSIRYYGRN